MEIPEIPLEAIKEMIDEYILNNVDREKLSSRLDYDLFNDIIELFNSCL